MPAVKFSRASISTQFAYFRINTTYFPFFMKALKLML